MRLQFTAALVAVMLALVAAGPVADVTDVQPSSIAGADVEPLEGSGVSASEGPAPVETAEAEAQQPPTDMEGPSLRLKKMMIEKHLHAANAESNTTSTEAASTTSESTSTTSESTSTSSESTSTTTESTSTSTSTEATTKTDKKMTTTIETLLADPNQKAVMAVIDKLLHDDSITKTKSSSTLGYLLAVTIAVAQFAM